MTILNETFTLSNDVPIPKLAFGTAPLRGEDAYNAVLTALKAGYRHIDTAQIYNNEQDVGRAIKDSGIPREEIFITSKLDPSIKDYDQTLEAFEKTMERLELDYLDLFLIHAPWPFESQGTINNEGNMAAWQGLEMLYKEGSVCAIGVSNFDEDDIKNILWHGVEKPHANQIKLHVGHPQQDIVDFCKSENILVEAYSPLSRGKHLGDAKLRAIAQKHDVSTAQVALRFLLEQDLLPVARSANPEHIKTNTKLSFTLDDEDFESLRDLTFEE